MAQDTPKQATSRAELERQIMDPNVPKNEREWWARREIERLREEREHDLIRRLTHALEACLGYLDREAAKEQRREAGKSLRQVTVQQRRDMAHKAVDEAFRLLSLPAREGK